MIMDGRIVDTLVAVGSEGGKKNNDCLSRMHSPASRGETGEVLPNALPDRRQVGGVTTTGFRAAGGGPGIGEALSYGNGGGSRSGRLEDRRTAAGGDGVGAMGTARLRTGAAPSRSRVRCSCRSSRWRVVRIGPTNEPRVGNITT